MVHCKYSESAIMALLYKYADDIIPSDGMQSEKNYLQHGDISCFEHSVAVAYMSVKVAWHLRVNVDMKSMIRGAMLHDYFLYDWHVADKSHRFHGFIHAKCALKNAEQDFSLNPVERDIILKHMFPLNFRLPRYRESIIVTIADKICATREVLSFALHPMRRKYQFIK
jgi:uncharacterized protein